MPWPILIWWRFIISPAKPSKLNGFKNANFLIPPDSFLTAPPSNLLNGVIKCLLIKDPIGLPIWFSITPANFLGIKVNAKFTWWTNGVINLDNGSTTYLSKVSTISSATFLASSFNGLNAILSSPSNPPSRMPSFNLPSIPSLNSSEVVIIPNAEPIAAEPKSPNGPPITNEAKAPALAPLAAPGTIFLINPWVWLSNVNFPPVRLPSASFGPKYLFMNCSLFFK